MSYIKETKCYYCGDECIPTRDHVYPKSIGGRATVACCYTCNQLKGNLLPEQWILKVQTSSFSKGKIHRIVDATEKAMVRLGKERAKLKIGEEIDLRQLVSKPIKKKEITVKKPIIRKNPPTLEESIKSKKRPKQVEKLKAINGCSCGTSVITSMINTYEMTRFWKLGVYQGASNPCNCNIKTS